MKNRICLLTVLLFCTACCFGDEPIMTEREQQLFDLINERRAQCGLSNLIPVKVIVEECREWSAKLHRERKLYHWHGGGENCGRGYDTPKKMFIGWRKSNGHNAFLHNKSIKYAGIGEHENYWTFRAVSDIETYETKRNKQPQK